MAGLGRKVFAPGEVLTATNVQNYLMDQAVQVYAGTAARGSAIGTATTEGMVSWLADTDQMQVAVGTASWQNINLTASYNYIINGAFDVWQRGTASTASGVYLADRFYHAFTGTATISRSTDVPTNEGFVYSLSFASTSGTNPFLAQRIESVNSTSLAGKTLTISVWAKSTVGTGPLSWDTAYPTATDNWGSETLDASGTFAATMTVGTWTRYSATFTANALATRGYRVTVYRSVTSTSTTTLYTGMQLELGSVATPFRRNAPSIQGELAACQRYYVRLLADNGGGSYFAFGQAFSGTSISMYAMLPVNMRITPSALDASAVSNFSLQQGALTPNGSFSINVNESSTKTVGVAVTVASGATTNQFYRLLSANANAYIGFTSEL
jgi:hypothetical protein